ncbi:GAK system XXXCH domain-containing protein [Humidesulfovibrio sp.]
MSSWKLETELGANGLPGFLRELAAALERGQPELGQSEQGRANAVPSGSGALAGLPARELRKLVLVAEATGGGMTLKLKAKRAHELRVPTARSAARSARPVQSARPDPKAADASARAREKYRQLKKALQADFKALHKAAEAGLMPAQDVLESFLALSESMVEMPQPLKGAAAAGGHGPEAAELARANGVYLEDARALRRLVAGRDAAALLELLSRLERRRSACHAQFR